MRDDRRADLRGVGLVGLLDIVVEERLTGEYLVPQIPGDIHRERNIAGQRGR